MYKEGIIKRHGSELLALAKACDVLAVAAAGWFAYWLQFGSWQLPMPYYNAVLLALLVTVAVFPLFRVYEAWRGGQIAQELRLVVAAWFTVSLLLALAAVLTKSADAYSRGWMLAWFANGATLLVVLRIGLRYALRIVRARGLNQRHIVIVGDQVLGKTVAERLGRAPWTGMNLRGFFTATGGSSVAGRVPVLGGLKDIAPYVERHDVDEVWLAMPWRCEEEIDAALHNLRHSPVKVRMVPDIFSFRLLNHAMTDVAGLPVLDLSGSPMSGLNTLLKACEDRVIAAIILMLIAPVMLAIAVGVKLSSPGPVFFRQERVGLNGKPFMMLKFRSMPVNAESATGPVWARPGENRATRFGAFLRKTSLDELPQFINVLKGDMSIVGPRPERPVFVEQFKEEIPGYMQKHLVKAGITGWAQVNGWRGDTCLKTRIEHDLYYIDHWSLALDLKIIVMTIFKGMRHRNAY